MTWLESIILGIIQGLTEFLPVSSSGHLELSKAILGTDPDADLAFTVILHGATVLSTLVVFYREIAIIIKDSFQFKYNDSVEYLLKIAVSLIPVFIIGIFFKDYVESFFDGNIKFVGIMLLITGTVLLLTRIIKKDGQKNIPWLHAFLIGVAQAIAVLPGISRSGMTIATGLLLKNKREEVTKFSFLMVLIPVIGANFLQLFEGDLIQGFQSSFWIYLLGFFSAFFAGLLACRWMISLVKKGNLAYFAIYCFVIGIIAILSL
jgi:undecaprenyl-diphosphatase